MKKLPAKIKSVDLHPETHVWEKPVISSGHLGKFVSIRPCAENYEGKTFLGLYIGDIALSFGYSISDKGTMEITHGHHNPAIYVFDLKTIIFGCESWWTPIEDEDQLHKITDEDIDNIWYVKALKEISRQNEEKDEDK